MIPFWMSAMPPKGVVGTPFVRAIEGEGIGR